jgi:hypothetical protein
MSIQNIQVDGETIYSLSASDLELLLDEMPLAQIESDIKRRVKWVIEHKMEQRWLEFKAKWIEVLMKDPEVLSIPSKKADFISYVVARSDYKDRDARDQLAARIE